MPDASEFTGPVGYSPLWLVLAGVLLVLVVAYYVGVNVWAGDVSEVDRKAAPSTVDPARKDCTKRLAVIEQSVRAGRMPVRRGVQELSAAVRAFVENVSDLPASAMTLEELRRDADPRLAEAIALMYPSEFAPGEAATDDFSASLLQARQLVTTWT